MVPAATEAGARIQNQVEPVSVAMVPTARVQLTAVSTPVKPVVERTVQGANSLGNSKYQVGVLYSIEINQAKSHLSQRQPRSAVGGEIA